MPDRRNLRDRVASFFELPKDVIMDLPRITLMGDVELVVENHRGLTCYEADEVVLEVAGGHLSISGEGLSIGSLSPEQILIQGRIRALQYRE